MEELLGLGELEEALYESWSTAGYGMIITGPSPCSFTRVVKAACTWEGANAHDRIAGNVQVSPDHLGLPFDIAVPNPDDVDPGSAAAAVRRGFSRWAKACKPTRQQDSTTGPPPPLAIMQLNHPGRQSMRRFCGRPASEPALAPSAVPLVVGTHPLAHRLSGLLWGSPRAMTEGDIDRVVEQFVDGARLAHETGWDGVELHASHGYLLAQFMSPKVGEDARLGSCLLRLPD